MLTLVILPAVNIAYIDGGRQEKGPKIVDVICKGSLTLPNLYIFDAKLSIFYDDQHVFCIWLQLFFNS